jgi:hypothetical protein
MKKVRLMLFFMVLLTVTIGYSQTPFRVNVTAGINSPLGDFSNLYKSGVSAEAGIFFTPMPLVGLDLTFTAGYNGFKYKNEYFTGLVNTNLGTVTANFNYSWTATDIPIMIGGRFKLPVGTMRPYITGELGLHFVSFKDRFNGQRIEGNSSGNPVSFNFNGTTESGSEIGVGTSIGGGFEIPVLPKVNLDINLKYNYAGITYSKSYNIFRNNNLQYTTTEMKNLNYFTVRAGIVIDL